MRSRLAPLVVVATAIVATLALLSGVAIASSDLDTLVEIDQANDDMNSTAVEWSGATYNGDSHVLLTVDDEHNAYEFQLNADGTIDKTEQPRIIELDMGRVDFEGVAWLSGETYAFLSEGAGEVIIADVPVADDQYQTTIDAGQILRSFPVISGTWGNLGPEGLATDGDFFYVARELPSTLTKFDFAGNYVASVDLHALADASGVAVLSDGTFLVVSHESRMVAHYDIDWDIEQATLLASRDMHSFSQLEGIAVMGDADVYLFGEDNTRKGQAGQTYSHLNGALVTPSYAVSDVDCSGTLDIGDAMIIARIGVGAMEPIPGCGSGDFNNDGVVDLGDALMIAQCDVGVANVGCPADNIN